MAEKNTRETFSPDNEAQKFSDTEEFINLDELGDTGNSLTYDKKKVDSGTNIFDALAKFGPLIPLILAIIQCCAGLDARSLWFSDEVRHAAAYEAMVKSKDWLILTLNGSPYPDKPPLYFWFLYALDHIPHIDPPRLFLFSAAICACFFTLTTWILAKALGYDKKYAFVTCLVLLSTFSFLGISHYARMDLLFASLISLSHVCLYRGWIKKFAPVWLSLGFIFMALACLVKGPLGIIFPLVTSVIFLIWRTDFKRASKGDGAFAFGLMLIIILSWASLVMLQDGGKDYLFSMLGRHTLERALDAWHHKQEWWFYIISAPLAWLPLTFIILFLPYERLPLFLKGIISSRKENPGAGWVWISLISGFVILSILSGKVGIYMLPLYPFAAIVTVRAMFSFGRLRSQAFFILLSIFLFILALIFALGGLIARGGELLPGFIWQIILSYLDRPEFTNFIEYTVNLKGLYVIAAICLIFSVIIFKKRQTLNGLMWLTVFFCTLAQPVAIITLPSLDNLMSPKNQAEILRNFANEGYHVSAFYVTAGTYTCYFGDNIDEINDWDELKKRLDDYPRLAVATRLSRWGEWQKRPELGPQDFAVINTQWIAERQYVVLVRNKSTMSPEKDTGEPGEQAEERSENTAEAENIEAENIIEYHMPDSQDNDTPANEVRGHIPPATDF